jgi:hypothetical protein
MVLWTSDSVCVQGDVTAKVGAGGKARGISQRLRDILWPWDPIGGGRGIGGRRRLDSRIPMHAGPSTATAPSPSANGTGVARSHGRHTTRGERRAGTARFVG